MKELAKIEDDRSEDYRKSLEGLSLYQLGDALRNGYEVEQEFNVDDWVVDKITRSIHIDVEVNANSVKTECGMIGNSLFRHATPEEIKA